MFKLNRLISFRYPVLSLILLTSIAIPAFAQWNAPMLPEQSALGTISVSGDAEVHVDPDICILRMGVQTDGKDLLETRKENDKIIKDVIALAKRYGMKKEDINVDYIYWDPYYSRSGSLKNSRVKNTVEFKIWNPQPQKFEDFIFDALSLGMTSVLEVNFRTTELEKYRSEARNMAMKNAKNRALSLVSGNGVTIGNPVKITENRVWERSFYRNWWGGSSDMYTSQMASIHTSDANSGDNVYAPGKLIIKASVNVVYDLVEE